MSFNFGNTSAIGTSTPAKRKYSLPPNSIIRPFFFGYVSILCFDLYNPLAAFGNFSFNTPATSAPPAFGTPVPTQTAGFGATPAFGQPSFGGASE